MSINIAHGYRIWIGDPTPFLRNVTAAVAPVRDDLDATLYAQIVADLIDRHDQGTYQFVETLKLDALHEFGKIVERGPTGTVFHHPHSFDLDLGFLPFTADEQGRWVHVLLHCQREEYRQAFEALPGVEAFPYWNGSDRPGGVTEQQWTERREAWRPLIEAGRISEVMTRWSYRVNPSPDGAHVMRDDVILQHLPSREERAYRIAGDRAVAEHFSGPSRSADQTDLREVVGVLQGPRRHALAAQCATSLRTITVADLNASR